MKILVPPKSIRDLRNAKLDAVNYLFPSKGRLERVPYLIMIGENK